VQKRKEGENMALDYRNMTFHERSEKIVRFQVDGEGQTLILLENGSLWRLAGPIDGDFKAYRMPIFYQDWPKRLKTLPKVKRIP